MLLPLGLLSGCGSDETPPPTSFEVTLTAGPADGWCCPNAPGPACPLVAVRLPASPAGAQAPISSLTVTATDANTGAPFTLAPPGRCAGIAACGHFTVNVFDEAGAPLDENQHFGFGTFELSVGESPSTTRRVHVELRNDRNEPLLDAAGAPVATELFFNVAVVDQGKTVADACLGAPPSLGRHRPPRAPTLKRAPGRVAAAAGEPL